MRRGLLRMPRALALSGVLLMPQAGFAEAPPLTFQKADRVLVLAPHPDDESLGCGGVLHAAARAGIPVHVVFLTNGDANELSFLVYERRPVVTPTGVLDMGRLRGQEALHAARALGLPDDSVTFLGYPDAGTMPMWTGCWGSHPPHLSLLTRVSAVPYQTALRPGAPYKPESVMQDLQTVLRRFRPTQIFVSHPDDAHPDHRAWYLYAMATLWETPDVPPPAVHPFLIHHKNWPPPVSDAAMAPLDPPPSLAGAIAWRRRPLDGADADAKREAIEAHATQIAYSRPFMLGFVRRNELFGDFPQPDLRPSESGDDLLSGPAAEAPDPRVQAPPQARESFVGIEWRHLERKGPTITATAELSRRLLPGTHAVFYFFGARPDRPFAQMPKVHVTVTALGHHVDDQDTPLPKEQVTVARTGRRLAVTVPLELLGEPRRLFIGAETVVADVLMHPAGWRIAQTGEWAANR